MTTRRTFIIHTATASAVATLGTVLTQPALAQTQVSEKDAQAASLGYKVDASKVDRVKYPKFVASQNCANCQLYQAKPQDKLGACPLFAGKQVAASAWCSAWVKKAA